MFSGDGTFVISPLNPLVFSLDLSLSQYLTFVEWMVYDVGPGGAKLVGNYAEGGGMQPDVNSYTWVPNGKQIAPDGTQYCAACTSCKAGDGVTNMTLVSKPGTGYSSVEVSQLYADASCGATCANLDGLFWTGMKYKCSMVSIMQQQQQQWSLDTLQTIPRDRPCCNTQAPLQLQVGMIMWQQTQR